jgi:hypothetical protein
LCRTQAIESAGSSAQSRSHASTGSGMQWNTDTWNAGAFLARPLGLRRRVVAAGGGIANSRSQCGALSSRFVSRQLTMTSPGLKAWLVSPLVQPCTPRRGRPRICWLVPFAYAAESPQVTEASAYGLIQQYRSVGSRKTDRLIPRSTYAKKPGRLHLHIPLQSETKTT